jgi:hypothetical protein
MHNSEIMQFYTYPCATTFPNPSICVGQTKLCTARRPARNVGPLPRPKLDKTEKEGYESSFHPHRLLGSDALFILPLKIRSGGQSENQMRKKKKKPHQTETAETNSRTKEKKGPRQTVLKTRHGRKKQTARTSYQPPTRGGHQGPSTTTLADQQ